MRFVEAHSQAQLVQITRHHAATEDLLRPRERGDARGDRTAGERFRVASVACRRAQRVQDHALEFLIVLGQDEVAEPLAHFLLDRRELAADVFHVRAAHVELGLELRVVGPEAELEAPVRYERLHPCEHAVDA